MCEITHTPTTATREEPWCESCGDPYANHLGVVGLCALVRIQEEQLEALKNRIIELERELLNVRLGGRRGKKDNVEAEFAPYYPEEAGDE